MTVEFTALAEPIPGYKLLEPLGKGGFGEVWKAEAPGGVLKAIKLVYGSMRSGSGDEVLVEQELKALTCVRAVRHPYILSMDRFDIIDGHLIIVMELADRCLADRFEECRRQGLPGIPRSELLRYLEETAEALDLMNIEYKLQHSDIKPQNLFLVHNHVKVADFGLVKDLTAVHAMTSGGFSPIYAAPETFDGKISECSDQYSLAIVFQELLTGARPFDGKNPRILMMQHHSMPPNLEGLPAADREILSRALAKKPQDRFRSCSEMVKALRQAGSRVQPPVPASPDPGRPPAGSSLVETMQVPSAAAPPSPLTFPTRCPGCGYTGRVPNKAKGKHVKCRECGTAFAALPVPEGDAAEAAASSPPAGSSTPAPASFSSPIPPLPKAVPPRSPAVATPPAASSRPAGPGQVRPPLSPPGFTPPSPSSSPAKPTALPPSRSGSVPTTHVTVPAAAPLVPPSGLATPAGPAPSPPVPSPPAAASAPSGRAVPTSGPAAAGSPAPPARPVPAAAPPRPVPAAATATTPPAAPPPAVPTATIAPAPPIPAVSAPLAAGADADVECPVCGCRRHTIVPNHPGSRRCVVCGCVHQAVSVLVQPAVPARAVSPTAVKPVLHATLPRVPELAGVKSTAVPGPSVECPVCGTRSQPMPGGNSIRCPQCGCAHRG